MRPGRSLGALWKRYIYIKIFVRVLRRFVFFGLCSPAPSKNTATYDTRCLPASKTPLCILLGASQPRKQCYLRYSMPPRLESNAIYNTWCLLASKNIASDVLGAHRMLKDAALGLLGTACRIEILASDLLGTVSLLDIPACVNECKSLPHFAAFLFTPVRLKSLPVACWALPERSNLLLQVCSAPPFHLNCLSV